MPCFFCDIINKNSEVRQRTLLWLIHALIIVASVLDTVAKKNDTDAYRIGGDEFAILVEASDKEMLQSICDDIEEQMKERSSEEHLEYKLSVSCGYAVYGEDSKTDIQDIIELADQKMYENKRIYKN